MTPPRPWIAPVQLSPHFVDAEFRCKHCGRLDGPVEPALVTGLEALRALAYSTTGLIVVSGYRCPKHNVDLGGAKSSMHLYRAAADVFLRARLDAVEQLQVFSGIGWQRIDGRQLVRHVDVRHATDHNPFGGTVAHPNTWEYEIKRSGGSTIG